MLTVIRRKRKIRYKIADALSASCVWLEDKKLYKINLCLGLNAFRQRKVWILL
jgi:hypothetical protein